MAPPASRSAADHCARHREVGAAICRQRTLHQQAVRRSVQEHDRDGVGHVLGPEAIVYLQRLVHLLPQREDRGVDDEIVLERPTPSYVITCALDRTQTSNRYRTIVHTVRKQREYVHDTCE